MSGQVDRVRWIPGRLVLTLKDREDALRTGLSYTDARLWCKQSVDVVDAFIHRMLKS